MPELLTLDEAAAYLKVPAETLRKWRSQGHGPQAVKLGRHLRYRLDEIDRWIAEQEQQQHTK